MVKRVDVATLLRRLKRRPLGQTFLLVSIALVVVLGHGGAWRLTSEIFGPPGD